MVEKLTLTWEIMSGSWISASPRTIIWPRGRYTSMSLTKSAKEITWGKLSKVRLDLPLRKKLLANLISIEYKKLFLCDFSILSRFYQNTLSVGNSELYGCSLRKYFEKAALDSSNGIGVVSQHGDMVGFQRAAPFLYAKQWRKLNWGIMPGGLCKWWGNELPLLELGKHACYTGFSFDGSLRSGLLGPLELSSAQLTSVGCSGIFCK